MIKSQLTDFRPQLNNPQKFKLKEVTLEIIADKVCEVFGITFEELSGPRRLPGIVDARKVYALVAVYEGKKLKKTGDFINRDHSTIIYNSKQCKDIMPYDPILKEKYSRVKREILRESNRIHDSIRAWIE
jgi:chromosomal replication initiation ATPase DnaA